MGLDDRAERKFFYTLPGRSCTVDSSYDYDEFCKLYSNSADRIDCRKAFFIGKDVNKSRGWGHWAVEEVNTQKEFKHDALDVFKAFAVMMHRIKLVRCDPDGVKAVFTKISEDCNLGSASYSPSDVESLYRATADYFSGRRLLSGKFHYPLFGGELGEGIRASFRAGGKSHDISLTIGEPTVLQGDKFRRKVHDFNHRLDSKLYPDACDYLQKLIDVIDIDIKHEMSEPFQPLKPVLRSLICRLEEELEANQKEGVPFTYSNVNTYLNSGAHLPANKMDCCIAGPSGKSREASFLYFLDPSVHTWDFQGSQRGWSHSQGLAIFVEATGRHCSKSEPEEYLVLEGFPANQEFYSGIEKLNSRGSVYLMSKEGCIDFPEELTLPKLVYLLGILTAGVLGKSKLFINTEHKGAQKSVEYAVREAARSSNLRGDCWDFSRHAEFRLTNDPVSGHFQTIQCGDAKFEYTHVLEKPQLSADIVAQIRKNPDWNGEGFFDTWYGWNRFIMDTYDSWSPEEKARHPYAESVAKRGKDPQWNSGIGYCKGFEVDVKKECERLGIS